MNNNFLITIHDYESNNIESKWMDIEDFIESNGIERIDEYFDIESNFISSIKSFGEYFSKDRCFDSLAAKIEVYEYDSDYNFYRLDGNYEKLKELSNYNFSLISDSDKEFVYRCQCRGMCSIWLIDVLSMSYIKSAMDAFFLHVYLNLDIDISSIFKKNDNVFFYYDKDTLNTDENYDYPKNCGDKVRGLN